MLGRKWGVCWGLAMILSGACLAGSAQAASITVTSSSGSLVGFNNFTGTLFPILDGSSQPSILNTTTLTNLLQGNSTSVGGGVLISGGATITGTIGSDSITLSGLVYSDWFGSSNLAERFISDAAASVGIGLTNDEINKIKSVFDTKGYWSAVSNPYIGYVNRDQGVLRVGLQGHLNATLVLKALFDDLFVSQGLDPIPADISPPYQVSDVVKVSYQGLDHYLYGFKAIDSKTKAFNPYYNSSVNNPLIPQFIYTGLYEVTIPEPTTWLLMLSALFALTGAHVLRSRSA